MTKPSFRTWGAVQSTAISRALLFEDERNERLAMPFADKWIQRDSFKPDWTTLELDVGSVLGFNNSIQEDMADRVRSVLEEVGRICKADWHWFTSERTITTEFYASELMGNGRRQPDDTTRVHAPTDHRKFLSFNFASRDDAMLVRMTIEDLRSVKNADSGNLSEGVSRDQRKAAKR